MVYLRQTLPFFFLLLTVLALRGQVSLPKAVAPYKSPDFTKIVHLAPMLLHPVTDSALAVSNSKEYMWGEAEALLYEMKRYNLQAQAVVTDGRSNFEKAERPFMAMIYTGMGLCNLAAKYPDLKPAAAKECTWLLDALQTNAISGFMNPHFGVPFPSGNINKASVLVHGQFLYLALLCRQTFDIRGYDMLIHKVATALATDFAKSETLPSYPGMWYVSDNLPALAALKNYDKAFKTNLSQKPVAAFLALVKRYYLDTETGLTVAYVGDAIKKTTLSKPQGVGIMYGLPFLYEIDSAFTCSQWQTAKQFLLRNVPQLLAGSKQAAPYAALTAGLGKDLYACLEHPETKGQTEQERNAANSDSGPIFFGAGTAASGFAVAAATKVNDLRLAKGLEKLAIALGKPTWTENRLYYENMVDPVGQAIVFYGKTLAALN